VVAFLLVELGAVAVPSWRRRRHGDRDARAPILRAAIALAITLTLVQAWQVVAGASAHDDMPVAPSARIEVMLALCAGVALHVAGAVAIDRWGLGRGWGALLALAAVIRIVPALHGADALVALAAGALVAVVAAGATRVRADGEGGHVRLPIAGYAGAVAPPLVLAAAALFLAPGVAISGAAAPISGEVPLRWLVKPLLLIAGVVDRAPVAIALTAATAIVLGALWTARLAGADRVRAVALGVAMAAMIASLDRAVGRGGAIGADAAVVLVALLDVAAEARARARGRWRTIAALHDVDAADDALLAGDAGAPRFARGVHVRALFRVFAPLVAVEILEAGDVDRGPSP
jgi:hypothetical protein